MDTIFNKVLFIGPDDTYGGIGNVINIYNKNIANFNFIPTHPSENISPSFYFLKSFFKIAGFLFRNKNIKIVHLHSASYGSFYRKSIIAIMSRIYGKKVVFHIHAGGFQEFYNNSGIFRFYIRWVLKMSSCVICLSEQWLEFFKNQLEISSAVILGNPIEKNTCQSYAAEANQLKLLFLGKICDNKGIFDLITYLKTNHYFLNDQIKLVIAGNGETERLKNVLQDPVLNKRITYNGWIAGHEKNVLISECDLFILPSYIEGLPVSILEAMAGGKAIIATNVGGIPSIVQNNYNGFLFEPGSFSQLEQIFSTIFFNKELLVKYNKNSLLESQKYGVEIILTELCGYYRTILTEFPSFVDASSASKNATGKTSDIINRQVTQ
jgi:glycosyltransferase involved in cell wall biosynthesis